VPLSTYERPNSTNLRAQFIHQRFYPGIPRHGWIVVLGKPGVRYLSTVKFLVPRPLPRIEILLGHSGNDSRGNGFLRAVLMISYDTSLREGPIRRKCDSQRRVRLRPPPHFPDQSMRSIHEEKSQPLLAKSLQVRGKGARLDMVSYSQTSSRRAS